MQKSKLQVKIQKFPSAPGVYQFIGRDGRILYVGKAASLKDRVQSYFAKPLDQRIEQMVNSASDLKHIKTDTIIEALILEANLIKKFQPPFNIRAKDDKTFINIAISDESFPRVFVTRPTRQEKAKIKYLFGPYTSAKQAKTALKILRKIFPFRATCSPRYHQDNRRGKIGNARPCLDYHLKLCPGVCIGKISAGEYQKNIRYLVDFLSGKKNQILKTLKKEMVRASKGNNFEKAAQIRDQIFALSHIQDVALISENELIKSSQSRVEAYDISDIFGGYAVGAMVVIINGQTNASEYRKFKIRTIEDANDTAMMAEILERRLKHLDWPRPDLIAIDGGKAHLNLAKKLLKNFKLKIPVTAIAKGPTRQKNEFFYDSGTTHELFKKNPEIRGAAILARDEAHRFAIKYHRTIRDKIE